MSTHKIADFIQDFSGKLFFQTPCSTDGGPENPSVFFVPNWLSDMSVDPKVGSRGKWGRTDHRLSGLNQRCYMLEYIIATFVLVCPSRAGHMVALAGTVSDPEHERPAVVTLLRG